MRSGKNFQAWVGEHYETGVPKLLIIGESRYDKRYTDWRIVQDQMEGGRVATFTNFVQAITGWHYTEAEFDPCAFWARVIYYNYNATFFPGRARVLLDHETRRHPQHRRLLRDMLKAYRPSHAIIWGLKNWEYIEVEGCEWSEEQPIPGTAPEEPYCTVEVAGHRTLFTRVRHPSSGFSYIYWAPVLKAFLELS